MTGPKLITHADQVTPDWLNSVFSNAGIDGKVSAVDGKSIGTGQVGENIRFELQGDTSIPQSLVGKFVSPDPVSRQTGIQQQTYLKEVFFYKNLQDKTDIQTAKILFADINEETHDFIVLMQDLAPGEQGNQLTGCSIDDAALALEQAAKLHGPVWGDQQLNTYPLLNSSNNEERAAQLQMIYGMVLPKFLERYNHRLPDEHIKVIEKMADLLIAYQTRYQGPKTLLHSDYRLDNMMFNGPYPLAIVDWQTIGLGCGVNDVSYFMGTSLLPSNRLAEEQALIKHYLEVLKSYQVELSWNDCWLHYRHFSAAGLIMAVIASMIVEETDRGNDMFMAMATRSCQQVIELDCLDLLRG